MYAFVSLPFKEVFDPVFKTLVHVAMRRGLMPLRTQSLHPSTTPSAQAITERHIRNSRFIIADLTGNDPNVEQEVRCAHRLGTPCILISQQCPEKTALPLHRYRIHPYDIADLESLQSALLRLVVPLSSAVEHRFAKAWLHDATTPPIRIQHPLPGQWRNPFING